MAEASDQATSVCSHCDRVIPIPNIESHYAYCSRNLVKCKACGDMVSRKLIEEHFLVTHASVLDTVKWHLSGGPQKKTATAPRVLPDKPYVRYSSDWNCRAIGVGVYREERLQQQSRTLAVKPLLLSSRALAVTDKIVYKFLTLALL